MKQSSKFLLTFFLAITLATVLVACTKINQRNFNKIAIGMSMKQVIAILGEPTESESINFIGISGTSAMWKDKHSNSEIDIMFFGDQVQIKNFSKYKQQSDANKDKNSIFHSE